MSELEARRPAGRVDDTILRYADSKSPEEISTILKGVISAKAVAAHTQKLLASRNWLTAAQEDQLVTLKMRALLIELEDQFQDDKMMALRLKTIDKIGERLSKRRAATEADLSTYDANVGRVLGRVVDQTLSYMKGALREQVDPDLWDSLVKEALYNAQAEIAKYEAIEP